MYLSEFLGFFWISVFSALQVVVFEVSWKNGEIIYFLQQ